MKQTVERTAEAKMHKETVKRRKFICFVLDALNKKGSWCSLMHIQNACYVAQEIFPILAISANKANKEFDKAA